MTHDIAMQKDLIRRQTLEISRSMSCDERHTRSEVIQNQILELPPWRQAETVMLYVHMPHEVATDKLLEQLRQAGRSCVVPKCQGGQIIPCRIDDPESDLAMTPWGVREPWREPLRVVELEELDFVLVPGVAFDRQGNRIGYGRGYYDRFLARLAARTYVLGVGYGWQIVAGCPVEGWDCGVPRVLTEEGMVWEEQAMKEMD